MQSRRIRQIPPPFPLPGGESAVGAVHFFISFPRTIQDTSRPISVNTAPPHDSSSLTTQFSNTQSSINTLLSPTKSANDREIAPPSPDAVVWFLKVHSFISTTDESLAQISGPGDVLGEVNPIVTLVSVSDVPLPATIIPSDESEPTSAHVDDEMEHEPDDDSSKMKRGNVNVHGEMVSELVTT